MTGQLRIFFTTFLLATSLVARPQESGSDWDTAVNNMNVDYYLILGASEGDSALVHRLIDSGANVNAETYEGVTPLMYASQGGYNSIVKLLIDKGASVDGSASNGYTALISAITGRLDPDG